MLYIRLAEIDARTVRMVVGRAGRLADPNSILMPLINKPDVQ